MDRLRPQAPLQAASQPASSVMRYVGLADQAADGWFSVFCPQSTCGAQPTIFYRQIAKTAHPDKTSDACRHRRNRRVKPASRILPGLHFWTELRADTARHWQRSFRPPPHRAEEYISLRSPPLAQLAWQFA